MLAVLNIPYQFSFFEPTLLNHYYTCFALKLLKGIFKLFKEFVSLFCPKLHCWASNVVPGNSVEWSVCREHALETLLKSESSNSRPKNNGVMVLTAIAIATTNYYKI